MGSQSRSASRRKWHKVRSGQKEAARHSPCTKVQRQSHLIFFLPHGRKEYRSSWAWDYNSVASFLLTQKCQITVDVMHQISIHEMENWKYFSSRKPQNYVHPLGKLCHFLFCPFSCFSSSPFLPSCPQSSFLLPFFFSLFLSSFLPQTYLLSVSHELRLFWNQQIQHFIAPKTLLFFNI